MALLSKPKHEMFAQLVARGDTRGKAYVSAYGATKGADQSALRLLKNAQISARIAELRLAISSKMLSASIRERNFRLQQLQNRHDSLMQVIKERGEVLGKLNFEGDAAGKDETPAPGAGTGLVCLDWRGKDAVRAVWKVDTGLLAELRALEEQAARELGELNPAPNSSSGGSAVQVNVTFVSAGNGAA